MNPARSCPKKDQIFAYSSNMAGAGERARIEAHLSLCPACRKVLAGYAELDRVLGEWRAAEPSPWFDARVRALIASAVTVHPWYSLSGFGGKRWTAVAVIGILAVGTSFIALQHGRAPARGGTGAIAASSRSTVAQSAPPPASALTAQQAVAGPPTTGPAAGIVSASQEMDLYEHLKVLENYDMLANFDVLSELPQASDKSSD